jgi:hypothetical protein
MTSILASVSMLDADSNGPVVAPPIDGPAPPEFEVEKKTGSNNPKSFSSVMRCIKTEPTIPRHPTNPTFFTLIAALSRF